MSAARSALTASELYRRTPLGRRTQLHDELIRHSPGVEHLTKRQSHSDATETADGTPARGALLPHSDEERS